MRRDTSRRLPSGQVINHEYGLGQGPGASWHKVTTGLSPNLRWTKTVFDGFGRTLEVISGHKVGSTETAVSKVVTEYTPCACSSIGKVKRTSMPFAASGSPAHWTTYEYDEIGRTVKVTPPGNAGFTSYQYGGTTAKTIDPKGKWKKFENDALGNLITVWEPHPVGPGADYVTSYTYTLLGKLNVVTMTRPGKGVGAPPTVTQTRTYAYNSYGELQSVTHPENGTTLYEYFDDGSLKKKTDAKGQRLEWSYDAEGRPVTVKRFSSLGVEDVCARVTTTYGSQGLDGSFSGANLAGRLASVTTGCQYVPSGETETKGGRVDELYSYNSAGAVVTKRVRILRGNSVVTKDIGYTFDGEGKLASMQYPDEAKPYVMSYDAMARPSGMTQEYQLPGDPAWLNRNWVSGVSYGVAGQLLGMSWYGGGSSTFGETRTYNERLQLTRQQATGMDLEYVFTDGQNPMNDGRIIARINRLNTAHPETVTYKYDELNRLIEAEQTTGPPPAQGQPVGSNWWGMTWDFDGFGNRWSQDQKAGRVGIPNSVTFDLGTNRVNSQWYGHDANGNMTSMPGVNGSLIYDIDNRLTKVDRNGSNEQYRYLGDNKRYWKRTNQGGSIAEEYYLYGVGGQRIASYPASYNEQTSVLTVDAANKKLDVYFGGRVIWQNGRAIVQDRLGSVMARGNGSGGVESHDYYPYGEERVATVGDRNKFGTYHRDQTGLDYADQRYYNSAIGRFLTSDPYEASGGAAEPGSWGRGGYVGGDPTNSSDPDGLETVPIGNGLFETCEQMGERGLVCFRWSLGGAGEPKGGGIHPDDHRKLFDTAIDDINAAYRSCMEAEEKRWRPIAQQIADFDYVDQFAAADPTFITAFTGAIIAISNVSREKRMSLLSTALLSVYTLSNIWDKSRTEVELQWNEMFGTGAPIPSRWRNYREFLKWRESESVQHVAAISKCYMEQTSKALGLASSMGFTPAAALNGLVP